MLVCLWITYLPNQLPNRGYVCWACVLNTFTNIISLSIIARYIFFFICDTFPLRFTTNIDFFSSFLNGPNISIKECLWKTIKLYFFWHLWIDFNFTEYFGFVLFLSDIDKLNYSVFDRRDLFFIHFNHLFEC